MHGGDLNIKSQEAPGDQDDTLKFIRSASPPPGPVPSWAVRDFEVPAMAAPTAADLSRYHDQTLIVTPRRSGIRWSARRVAIVASSWLVLAVALAALIGYLSVDRAEAPTERDHWGNIPVTWPDSDPEEPIDSFAIEQQRSSARAPTSPARPVEHRHHLTRARIRRHLAAGLRALKRRRWQQARQEAARVLELDPTNRRALRIKHQAEVKLQRRPSKPGG